MTNFIADMWDGCKIEAEGENLFDAWEIAVRRFDIDDRDYIWSVSKRGNVTLYNDDIKVTANWSYKDESEHEKKDEIFEIFSSAEDEAKKTKSDMNVFYLAALHASALYAMLSTSKGEYKAYTNVLRKLKRVMR